MRLIVFACRYEHGIRTAANDDGRDRSLVLISAMALRGTNLSIAAVMDMSH